MWLSVIRPLLIMASKLTANINAFRDALHALGLLENPGDVCVMNLDVDLGPLHPGEGGGLTQDPPREFRIFKAGSNATSKGEFKFTSNSVASVMAAFQDHGQDQLPIDFDHGMVAGGGPQAGKAAGWFTPQVRANELWAVNVQWTPAAADMLRNREFRFISPAFLTDREGRITRLINVAITNLPATKDLVPLVAHETADNATTQEQSNMSTEALLKVLGADSESDAIVIATEHSKWTQQVLSATGTKSLDNALASIVTNAAQAEQVVTLAARVAELEKAAEGKDREALIAKLSEEGKAPPSLHAVMATMSLDQLEALGKGLPKYGPADDEKKATPEDASVTLSEHDEWVCQQLGIDPADMIANYKAEKAVVA